MLLTIEDTDAAKRHFALVLFPQNPLPLILSNSFNQERVKVVWNVLALVP